MNVCPSTSAAVQISSERLNCTPSLVYHCLRDQTGRLTQKCIKPSWIQKGHCAEYNTIAQRLDAKACTATRGLCPQKPYLSNEVISFSGCAPTEPRLSTTTITNSSDINPKSSGTALLSVIIPIISLAVLVIVVSLAVVCLFKRRRQQENAATDEENSMPLIEQKNHGNESKEKRKEYLKKEERNLKYFKDNCESPKQMLVKVVKENLQNHKNVVIIGKPGSGKTTLAWTVCKEMHGEKIGDKRWRVIVSTNSVSLPNKNEITLLLLDSCFENSWTTEKILRETKECCNRLSTKQIQFIWTMSRSAYNRSVRYFEFFKPFETVDLDNKDNSLNIVDMGNIFENLGIPIDNASKSKNSESLVQKELENINKKFKSAHKKHVLGFPLIASLMEKNRSFLTDVKFVQEPVKFIMESVEKLRESKAKSDNDKYSTMVYAVFNNGCIDTNQVDSNLLQTIGRQHKFQDPKFNADFYLLREKQNGCYEFFHESLKQLFFSAYGQHYLGFVIRHCPLHILLQYCVSSREKMPDGEKPFYLKIGTPELEKEISLRVLGSDIDITYHRIMEVQGFKETYDEVSEKQNALRKSTITEEDIK